MTDQPKQPRKDRGAVLSLNAGSSSLKFALFGEGSLRPATARGEIERIDSQSHLLVRDQAGAILAERRWASGEDEPLESSLEQLFGWIEDHLGEQDLFAVGHRVVHGGVRFTDPVQATGDILAELDKLCPLAPLHQPHNLAMIRAVQAARPDLPQVACFDTAFHAAQPAVARRFALPRALEEEGVLRYGFHGLSYEYIARRLAELDPALADGRVIAAHLGNGASLCAMRGGRGLDTTMGFTALDGLMMGTRTGALDPGVILYLLQQKGWSAEKIEHLLYSESGLLGVSGLSSDMRRLLKSDDPRAAEAVELFIYRIAREAGALASSLGGVDGLVFSAGIGEHAPEIRAGACRRLSWLGIALDEDANQRGEAVISTPSSSVIVRVVPTDEEQMIALHTLHCLDRPQETS